MARDYSKAEVLDIVENEARERGIPRDDFLRFAYIETGGKFDEQVSRGPRGAKGLFQFVPDTAKEYGIAGNELDAVANTDAAARLYLNNRRDIMRSHERTNRPYLSANAEPDGLDMYMAHQQGVGGYRSIQSAIAIGSFSRSDTRGNLFNNVSTRDFKAVTGKDYNDFRQMSDKDMATTFVAYWDTKFDRIRIPEKGIEPVAVSQKQDAPTKTPQPQSTTTPDDVTTSAITLRSAYDLSVKHDNVRYGFGSKDVNSGKVDCSGWVVQLQNATMAEINQQAGREVFSRSDRFSPGMDAAATIVQKSAQRSGVMIEGREVTKDVLKEGMIIGEDNGAKGWDTGRYKGIDHIVMVVRDPKSGELMVSQSRGGEGVELTKVDDYLQSKQGRGTKLFVTDPLAEARSLLQDMTQAQTLETRPRQKQTEASTDGIYRQGEKGEDIRGFQTNLNRLGYRDANGNTLAEDGDFGLRTRQAVEAYQRRNGLEVDGIVGPKTLASLGKQSPGEWKVTAPGETVQAIKPSSQSVLLSDRSHAEHALYKQALAGIEKLPPTSFRNDREQQNAAAAVAFESKVSGLRQIDHVALSTNGTGVFAVQGRMDDPAHHRIYLDKAQAAAQPIEASTQQMNRETQQQQYQPQPQQISEPRLSM